MPHFFEKAISYLLKKLQHQFFIFGAFVSLCLLVVIYFSFQQSTVNYTVIVILAFLLLLVLCICFFAYGRYSAGGMTVKPSVMIKSTNKRDRAVYAEIYNDGDEDITKFEVTIFWKQQGVEQKRDITGFINVEDDPLFQPFENVNVLKSRADKIFRLPDRSTDGKISIQVTGIGQRSKKVISTQESISVKQE